MKLIIINGPNLNLIGKREQDIYGEKSFEDYLKELRSEFSEMEIDYFQSNIEGEIIDAIQKVGFVYDLETFELEKTFNYGESREGWGLTHDNVHLIKTDGSERMWFLDPESFEEKKFIETYTNKRKAEKLNELEFIDGKIYANIWQQNSILIVNPVDGAIEAIINLKGLQKKAGQEGEDNVLNGIAYDEVNDRLFVTGKNWNKVFEIRIEEK